MFSGQGTTSPEKTPILDEEPQSYPSLNNPRSWRPLSLKRFFLLGTWLGALLLLGVTAFLHYLDHKNGAVLIADDGDGFTIGETFMSRYLPTILVVVYGILIALIDLDVKRLEPWYSLSEPGDFQGENPLLCRYDTGFVLSVMVKAFRKRYLSNSASGARWLTER